MILHGDTLISEDIIDKHFICNIQKCKGACCIEGDQGAPLEKEEIDIIQNDYEAIRPFLDEDGKDWIEKNNFYEQVHEDDAVTTCLPDGRCSFVVVNEDASLSCGIENAYRAGKTQFMKPISCHLYPIRVQQYATYHALNYHQWDICSDACKLGDEKGVRIFEFLGDALIRKFGKQWYSDLKKLASSYLQQKAG